MLKHLFRTLFGGYQYPFSKQWDICLNNLLDTGTVVELRDHILDLKNDKGDVYSIWVSNKFYSYGHLYRKNGESVSYHAMRRPSYKVQIKLSDYVDKVAEAVFK